MNSTSPSQSPIKPQTFQISHHNNSITSQFKFMIFINCTLLLCFLIFINAIYQTPLFIQGINFIYQYQTSQPYQFLHFVQNFFSLICHPTGLTIVMVIYYFTSKRKLLLLVHFSYFYTGVYIMALLKQAFQQSRPIWVHKKIQIWQWFCPKDFGNPSGHSFAVSLLYQPIFSDTIGYGKYRIWGLLLVFLCVMVPMSRMYLGVHSANQILFGLQLGLIFLNLYKYIYQRYLYALFYQTLKTQARILRTLTILFFHILTLIFPIIIYHINLQTRPISKNDLQNLNIRCNSSLSAIDIQVHMLRSSVVINFYFGVLYGLLFLNYTNTRRKYLFGIWKYQNYKHRLYKIIIFMLGVVCPAYIFVSLANIFQQYIFIDYLFHSLSYLSIGFGLSNLPPFLSQKWKLLKFLSRHSTQYEQKQLQEYA